MKKFLLILLAGGILTCHAKYGDKPMRAPDNMRIDQWAYLVAHNAFSSKKLTPGIWGTYPFYAQQRTSLTDQMEQWGVRGLMLDILEFDPKKILEEFSNKVSSLLGTATNFVKKIF